jgi:hypothetical protein
VALAQPPLAERICCGALARRYPAVPGLFHRPTLHTAPATHSQLGLLLFANMSVDRYPLVFNYNEYSRLDERMSRRQSPRTVKAPVLVNTLASAGASPLLDSSEPTRVQSCHWLRHIFSGHECSEMQRKNFRRTKETLMSQGLFQFQRNDLHRAEIPCDISPRSQPFVSRSAAQARRARAPRYWSMSACG